MNVNGINRLGYAAPTKSTVRKSSNSWNLTSSTADYFEKKALRDNNTIYQALDKTSTTTEPVREYTRTLITKQYAEGSRFYDMIENSLGSVVTITPTNETLKKADEIVGENGKYGIDNVSNQITNYVKNLVNGDMNQLSMFKSAIDLAFKDVAALFGGQLPEISQRTYEAVVRVFDNHKQNLHIDSVADAPVGDVPFSHSATYMK